ncbi:MAG TPA: BsuPI-related putative proteinase inhibitor [Acidimicrobiia bacterium]|nr:BsuPI-related putative proteinase inhibitor [Acidimicrobiia bacterium]
MSRRKRTVPVVAAAAVIVAVVVVAGLVAANQGGDGPSSRAEVTDKLGQRWVVNLAARPAEPGAGTPVEVTIGIANPTGNAQTISFPSNRQIELQAKDGDGKVVWRSDEPDVKVDLSRSIGKKPAEFTRTWSTTGLKTGRYTVEGAVLAQELEGRGRVGTAVVLR